VPAAQLFVAVSTEQRVANLPPILERANRGDSFVWIESPEARSGGWAAGATDVLLRAGLQPWPAVAVADLNDPTQVHAACAATVAECRRREGLRPVIVANGGPKFTPLGLEWAWAEFDPVWLYNDVPRAQLRVHEAGLRQPPRLRPYSRHQLDLPEILMVNGHQFCARPKRKEWRLWPGPPLPPEVEGEHYGEDRLYTTNLHRAHLDYPEKGDPGDALENAVARRVVRWAEAHKPASLQSVWFRVEAARREKPADKIAELDVILVVRNGVLLHLECKSGFTIARKDLEARHHNLRQASSLKADMVLCVPPFAEFAGERWSKRLHTRCQEIKKWQWPVLPLTLAHSVHGGAPTHGPSFEDELERLLKKYQPCDAALSSSG
jgi:hypothetical protein